MNRTLLIFIMIACALMIMVIGGKRFEERPEYMPWNIDIVLNNNIRVFGVTLGKTRIQDANQILASFADTHLVKNGNKTQLVAVYNELNMAGLIAEIELLYDLEENKLAELEKLSTQDNAHNSKHLPKDIEMDLLTTVVSKLTYKPSVDFEIDIILQRFGPAASEEKISENIEHWFYPDMGLEIIIDKQGPDQFIYSSK
jgi:hypothetical protein